MSANGDRSIYKFPSKPYTTFLTTEPIEAPGVIEIENPNFVYDKGNVKFAYKSKSITKAVLKTKVQKNPMFGYTMIDDTTSSAVRQFSSRNLRRSCGVELKGNELVEIEMLSNAIKPRIMAFDIETYTHSDARFPDPYFATDIIFLISCICVDGDDIVRKCCAVTPGEDLNFHSELLDMPLELTCVDTEYDLLVWFMELIDEFDPDIFTGYNLAYDTSYIEKRALFSPELKFNIPRRGANFGTYVDTQTYKYCVEVFGRVVVDMFEYMKTVRGTYELERLTLATVAQKFLNKSKVEMPYKRMFRMYREHIESGSAEIPLNLVEYCVYDSELAVDLFKNRDMWSYLIEFSNKYCATMRTVMQGTTTEKLNPYLYTTISHMNYIFNGSSVNGKYKISGGYVHLSEAGAHSNVSIMDFASLYPSVVSAYNICWSTQLQEPTDDCHKFPIVYIKDDQEISETLYFRKSPPGILPTILETLIAERAEIRKKTDIDSNNKQLVIKTISNAICGFLGCRGRSKYAAPLLNVAITQRGQMLIQRANKLLADKQCKHLYSDTDSSMVVPTLEFMEPPVINSTPEPIIEHSIGNTETFFRSVVESQYNAEMVRITDIYNIILHNQKTHELADMVTNSLSKPLRFEFETLVSQGIFMRRKIYVAEKVSLDKNLNIVRKLKLSGVCPKKTTYGRFLKDFYMKVIAAVMSKTGDPIEVLIRYASILKSYLADPMKWFDEFAIETKFKSLPLLSQRSFLRPFAERAQALGVPFVNNTPVVYIMCTNLRGETLHYTRDMLLLDAGQVFLAGEYYIKTMSVLYAQLTVYSTPKPSDRVRVTYDDTLDY